MRSGKKKERTTAEKDTAEKHQMDESGREDTDGQIRNKETGSGREGRWELGEYSRCIRCIQYSCSVGLIHRPMNTQSASVRLKERSLWVREKETQMEKVSSDGIIGELIEVGLGKDEQHSSCAQ